MATTMMDATECYAVPGAGSIIDVIHPDTDLTWCYGKTAEQVAAQEPGAVRMTIAAWAAAKATRQQTPITWDQTTREQFEDMLGVLPPIDWRGGAFLVGEASDHCAATGQPRYQAYRQIGSEYFRSSRPMTRVELRDVVKGGL